MREKTIKGYVTYWLRDWLIPHIPVLALTAFTLVNIMTRL